MAKKSTDKKSTDENVNDQFNKMEEFNTEVCRLKHVAINIEFANIKTDAERRHEEIKLIIGNFQETIRQDVKNSNDNLKDKIVLAEKTIGDKIDSLTEFDDTLKGNGTPGVWESIRALTWKFRFMIVMLSLMMILFIGGNIKGVTREKIKAFFGWKTETKQVEEGLHIYSTDGTLLKVDEEGLIIIEKKEEIPK